MREPGPVLECADLVLPLHEELLRLLEGLTPEQWQAPTRAGAWRVRDVVAHLLDGMLRKLSLQRDGQRLAPPPGIDTYEGLLRFLDALNRDWVEVAQRFSPAVLLQLVRLAGPQVAQFVASLDPFAEALFPVAWAGESRSLNWMDTGREYTEHWHHQQQVREAVGAPFLEEPRYLRPVIAVSLRALPRAWAGLPAADGALVAFEIEGASGGRWALRRQASGWVLLEGEADAPAARIRTDERSAWQLFFKALPAEERAGRLRVEGDPALAAPAARVLAVMA